ncbi:hypothetical protein SAMN04488689_10768 [Paenibacillus sp. cl6col]|nr:hypothetical protein SAMN04488689_10768 [Paenibacillus sp. cl6col]
MRLMKSQSMPTWPSARRWLNEYETGCDAIHEGKDIAV